MARIGKSNMRLIILLLAAVMPWSLKKIILSKFLGYEFALGARVGLAFIDARAVELGENSSIGSFTVIRNVGTLRLGANAKIGTFNWIFGMASGSGTHFLDETERESSLIIGDHSAFTSRHLIDCIDKVEIGRFTTIAGFRSQILTHSIDLRRNRQSCAPIKIGSRCFIGTGVIILKGVKIPDYCAIGAGTVVSQTLPDEGFIYSGNPAEKVREIHRQEGYFSRRCGKVS